MMNSHSIKSFELQQSSGNQRFFVIAGILFGHFCLIAFLYLLPQDRLEENAPEPMVMVELQPPVPLSTGNSSNFSQQAVVASGASASLSHSTEEGGSGEKLTTNNPSHTSAWPTPARVASQTVNAPASSTAIPAKTIATSVSPSETALSAPPSASQSGKSGNESDANKGDTAIASTAQASGGLGGHTSAPKYGAGYLSNPAPEYPSLARSMGEEGKVLLHVLVTPEGLAKKVKLHRTSGSDSLDDAAIKAVKKWRFVPAKLGEQNVEAWVYVPIVFKLD